MLFSFEPAVLKASFGAVAELLISCAFGALAARKGPLDRTVISSLSKVVYNIFLPSMLIVNVSRTVATRSLASLAPLPVFAWIQVVSCAIVAYLTCKVAGIDPHSDQGRELRVCGTFGNSGVLPLLFSNVILRNHPNPDYLPLAVSYVSFYLLGWSPLFWTMGYSQLAGDATTNRNQASDKTASTPKSLSETISNFIKDPPPAIQRILSPPIVASISGLVIGTTPLRRLFVGAGAPLSMIAYSVENLGKAYGPAALLVLAGSLALPTEKVKEAVSPVKKVALISLNRFLICPIVFLGILLKAIKLKFMPMDPLIMFVLFLEACMPSAQNLVIIHSLNGRAEAATRLARVLLFVYILSVIPLTLSLTLFMQRVTL